MRSLLVALWQCAVFSHNCAVMGVAFKLVSVNIRGIRSLEKRKSIFAWLVKQQADICFLQETYTTKELENSWKMQWKGQMFFSHGSEHSRGVLILIKNSLFELKSVCQDNQGRFVLVEASVQDQKFIFLNIYTPNKTNEQTIFFDRIKDELDNTCIDDDCRIIIGGDFNVILDPEFDGQGGNAKLKEPTRQIENICSLNL